MKILVFIVFASLFVVTSCYSQIEKTIQHLEHENQLCLDKGENMYGCTVTFYHQMDSLLNLTYTKLYHSLNISNQAKLKKEQRLWQHERDKAFKINYKKIHSEAIKDGEVGGEIEQMTLINQNTEFVKKRIMVLYKRLK